MMPSCLLTPAARDDIAEIWTFIASDNPVAADKLEEALFAAFEKITLMPDIGHWRRDLTDKPVRFFTVKGNYLVVYDPAAEPLQIIRVLHGARDAETLL